MLQVEENKVGILSVVWARVTATACAVNLLHLAAGTLIRLCSSARTSGCSGQCQCWENEKFALLWKLPWETSSPIISRGHSEESSNLSFHDLYEATWQHKKWPTIHRVPFPVVYCLFISCSKVLCKAAVFITNPSPSRLLWHWRKLPSTLWSCALCSLQPQK